MGRRSRAEIVRGILERDRDTLALSVQLDRAMPDAAQPDLTMRQVLALYLLLEAPRRVGELARELNVTISSASGLVDRLVAAGLVEREHGTADRRLVVCRLSDQGRRELEAFLQLGRLRLERVLARLSAQDRSDDGSMRRLAVFSVWSAVGCDDNPGCHAGVEGTPFWTCRLPYRWQAGRAHRLRVARTGPGWWSAWVGDRAGGAETLVGSIQVPAGWGGLDLAAHGSAVWVEFYAAN